MFERFTDRLRRAYQLANQSAQELNHEYLGCEHLLLGLLREGSGVACRLLKEGLNVDLDAMAVSMKQRLAPGPDIVIMGKLPHTPRTKQVTEQAVQFSNKLHNNYVGTEHLLLALTSAGSTDVDAVLLAFNVTYDLVLDKLRKTDWFVAGDTAAAGNKAAVGGFLRVLNAAGVRFQVAEDLKAGDVAEVGSDGKLRKAAKTDG